MGILDETKNEPASGGGEVIKFTAVGDAVVAKFLARRTGIKTSLQEAASAIDVFVVDSTIRGIEGGAHGTIWGSTHINQLVEDNDLRAGDGFVLRLAEVDRKTRFKKFFFKKLEAAELAEEMADKGLGGEEAKF